MPKEKTPYKCLSLIMLDSVIRANKKYYPQTLSQECKYEIKNNKIENLIKAIMMNLMISLLKILRLDFNIMELIM